MKVLVSGCNGFVGSNLTSKLIKLGHEIEGISKHPFDSDYKVHVLDLRSDSLQQKIRSNDFDAIVHLAADTNEKDFLNMFRNNVITTLNILELARKKAIKKFVYVSGHNVYSHSTSLPIKENFATKPLTNYGQSKLLSENLVTYYGYRFNLTSIILRISFIYGKGQHKTKMISKLINNYKNDKPISLHKYKNGFQKLDLIHVCDACDAIVNALTSKKQFGIYNIASGKPVTIRDILKILQKNTKSNSKITIKNIEHRTNHFYYDIQQAKKELNFRSTISLEKGISTLL